MDYATGTWRRFEVATFERIRRRGRRKSGEGREGGTMLTTFLTTYVPLEVEEKRRRGIVVTNPIIDKRIGTRIDLRTTALINYNEYRIRRPR